MAGTWSRRGLLIFIIISTIVVVESSKLNVPRVLLPVFNTLNLNFTLEGTERDCYKWSTSRPEIINLQPLSDNVYSECASKVIVSTNTREFVRNTAIVFAEELRTHNILRCDVIIDVISSLNVITTTRELFIEDAPEAFEIRAYDAQGNEFSTLEGVEFKWELSDWKNKWSNGKGTNVIRFMTFNESPYETPPTVQLLDSLGKRGHIVLLEGLKTGSAKVAVNLPYEEYKNVASIEVQLSVISNFIIRPVEVYLMPGDTLQYHILQVRNDRLEELSMGDQYFWEVEDSSIAYIDPKTNQATALAQGKTKVKLHDKQADETESVSKVPTAYLTVSAPCYMTLTILPTRNWAVLIGEDYEIIVDVYDKEDHKFHIGDGVEVTTLIPLEYFSAREVTQNGTYIVGQPIEVGTAQVRSTLSAIVDRKGRVHPVSPKISVQANMMIYKNIVVRPADVILPWDTILKLRYEVSLIAEGGDGTYSWSSSDSSVASVTQNGLVTTYSTGSAKIFAAMSSNPRNKGVSRFHVAPPHALEIVEYMLETEVGTAVFLHIALYTMKNLIDSSGSTELVPFTRCQEVPFHVHVSNDHFLHNTSYYAEPVGIACAAVGLRAVSVGLTKVTVSYDANALTDSVTLTSFIPLRAVHPPDGEVVLPVGSSCRLSFFGGPLPWAGKPDEHMHEISTGAGEDVVEVTEMISERQDVYSYVVLCKKLGEAEVTLTVANVPAVKHCKHAEAVASVRVLCAKPRYVSLQTDYIQEKSCPISVGPERVVMQSYPNTNIFVTVKDEFGRVFYNISSLQLDWSLSNSALAKLLHSKLVEEIFRGETTPEYYQVLKPKKKSGSLEVKVIIVGYNSNVLRELNIVPEYPPFAIFDEKGYEITPDISAVLHVMLVNDTYVSPTETVLFNHPSNKVVLNVVQGSGYYDLILNSDIIGDVSYKEGSRIVEVFPKSDGLLKIAVQDQCLPSPPALAQIQVVSLGGMQVEAPERVEKGKCVNGILRLLDSAGSILPVPNYDQMPIRPVFEDHVISVTFLDATPEMSAAGEIPFVITGIELGDRRLWFLAGEGEQQMRSPTVSIQVFPPLRLLPHNVTLVIGAIFQVSSRGGPQPDANVEFSISGSSAKVDKNGIVEGLSLGQGTLVGRSVGYSHSTEQRVVYSQDSIDVFVVPLKGIKIHAPITRIINGATVPIWANGIPEQISPLILGSTTLPIRYNWDISSSEIASLNNVYHRIKLAVSDQDLISMHLKALKPGKVTVTLKANVPAVMTGQSGKAEVEFKSSINVEVFDELRLLHPPEAGELQSPFILMSPNSETYLHTNHEGAISYTLMDKAEEQREHYNMTGAISKALSSIKKILTVHKDGRIVTHSAYGRAVVLVTAREESGLKRIMSVTVAVKAVHYMLVSLRPDFIVHESETISLLPRGAEVELYVTYHDNTGAVFTAVEPDIKLRINRFDLTKMTRGKDKHVVLATMMNHGSTMLKVWDDVTHQHAADYIRLKTGEGILPPVTTITLGDVVCFSVPFVSKDERSGNWANDNPAVIELNSELGIGRARSQGTAVVKYHFTDTAFTSKEIKVLPLHKVKILPLKEYYVTNSQPEKMFSVPLVLRSEIDKTKTTNMITRNGTCPTGYMVSVFPFICTLAFTSSDTDYYVDDVFAVHQGFDLDSGQYLCTIEAAGDQPPNLSMLDTNISLTVQSGDIVSTPLILRFLPAVYVSTPEVHLTQLKGTLIINGIPEVLDDLEILPSNHFISITRAQPETPTVSSAVYHITLSEHYWEIGELSTFMNLTVASSMTKQQLQVPLRIHLTGEKIPSRSPCIVSHVSTWGTYISDTIFAYRHTLMITATLLIVLVVTAYGYTAFVQPLNELRRESLIGFYAPDRRTTFAPGRRSVYVRPSVYYGEGRSSIFGRSESMADFDQRVQAAATPASAPPNYRSRMSTYIPDTRTRSRTSIYGARF